VVYKDTQVPTENLVERIENCCILARTRENPSLANIQLLSLQGFFYSHMEFKF
jgi:hypothetical protein